MPKKHSFEEDTKKEAFITPPVGIDTKVADGDLDVEIEIDESEVEEETDRRDAGRRLPETD